MYKKLALLSVMLSLGACETINQASQCDPEKNYIKSNPTAMDEYKELRKKGEVKSFYTITLPTSYCATNMCVFFNNNKFDYIERYFNDSKRSGIYTVTANNNVNGKNCITEDPSTLNMKNKLCYETIKNNNDIIKSRYKYEYDQTRDDQTIISVYDLKKNVKLYEYSYQVFSHRAIGGPGIGFCKKAKDNNPNYKFNAVSFLMDN